ncbi:MAG: cysteine desulfurase [Candidatus Aenigmarchaeota archaeon]|nr:cysteine desulfurase [Candidatus Aenigmarchaeota archaeon]
MDVEKIRGDFPILKRKINNKPLVFLDSASTSQKPQQVIDAIKNYYENHNANPHRSIYTLCDEATQIYEKSRGKVSKFINAKKDEEIVFVRNTNEAMNIVAYSYAMNNLKEGDEILLTIMEHHANIVPWQMLQKKGVKLKFIDINDDGTLKMDTINDMITKNTKIVSVVHKSNVLGTINHVKEIGKIAHDNGSLFVVDGAQSVPHMPVDVKDIDCDFLAFSGHKMLAPMNIGVLYGKKEILEKMEPFMRGSDMIKEVQLTESVWNDSPWKFEAGTPNVEGAIGLSEAIDYLKGVGLDNISGYEEKLTEYALEKLNGISGVKLVSPGNAKLRNGVISFNIGGVHSHDIAYILDEFGVAIRSGHMCAQPLLRRFGFQSVARASFYLYNAKEEIDTFVEGLEKVKKVFGK